MGTPYSSRTENSEEAQVMQQFEMPRFYMPFEARCNPNVDAAREHSKAWAWRVGMLRSARTEPTPQDDFTWTDQEFDVTDTALFGAYYHPDAPVGELNLMTDWLIWGFFADDDFFDRFKRTNDMAGAKAYVARLPLFMPIFLTVTPIPTNAVERSLVDLWFRTTPSKSVEWRCRLTDDIITMASSWLWELFNIAERRITDPIDYFEMRRKTGGGRWTACLVEHAAGIEIPLVLYKSRPIRVLIDTFDDVAFGQNDVFSYDKEMELEGELGNGVLVVKNFLNSDLQRAVNIHNDIITSRTKQFEYTAATELPALFEELAVDPITRAKILKYVEALKTATAGRLQWYLRSGRYPNVGVTAATASDEPAASRLPHGPTGIGTSAALIGTGVS
jgi:germacradienol/geosmin synthase